MERILYAKPSITELEKQYVADAVESGWGDRCYDYLARFETEFAQYLGVRYCIATSSCTGAMQLGLAAIGLKMHDEVILANSNWVATVAPIVQLGATPVFVDIEPNTWCIDPNLVVNAITSKTKAIIATHLYGNLCNMSFLLEIGERFGIPIIEDSAEAIGSIYGNNKAGSMGKFSTFSFHGTKTLTTGEGGAFLTNDRNLYEHVLTLSNHGRAIDETKQFWPSKIGYKYKMSNIQAALGCAQLERVDELVERKKVIFSCYEEEFNDNKNLRLNPEQVNCVNGYWMTTAQFLGDIIPNIDDLLKNLHDHGISARRVFWPLSETPPFEKASGLKTPVSKHFSSSSINLPSYHDITRDQIAFVAKILRDAIQ